MTHQITVRRRKHSWQTRREPLVIKNNIGQFLASVGIDKDGVNTSWQSGYAAIRFKPAESDIAQKAAALVGGEIVNELESEADPLQADDEED